MYNAVNFVLLIVGYTQLAAAHYGYMPSALSRETVLHEVTASVNMSGESNTTLSRGTIEKMMKKIGFKTCTIASSSNCNLCTPIDVLLTRHRLSTDAGALLSRQQFLNLLPSLVFLLGAKESGVQNLGTVCNTSSIEFPLSDNTTAFHGVARQHGGRQNDTLISEAVLDSLLDTLNNTIGHLLNSSGQCFSVRSIYAGTNLSSNDVTERNFELVSAFILIQVLHRNCISKIPIPMAPLPLPKTKFVNTLFTKYGVDGIISAQSFDLLLKTVGIGGSETTVVVTTGNSTGTRKKRAVGEQLQGDNIDETLTGSLRTRRAINNAADFTSTCQTSYSLLKIFNIDETKGLNVSQFAEICPSIVQQVESGICKTHAESTKATQSGWKPWVSAMVSVLVISLGSLAGIAAAPVNNKRYFNLLLTFMIAIAAATLLGDGILHLMPHALGLHKHGHSEGGAQEEHNIFGTDSFLWKCVAFICGVYMFYATEVLMQVCAPDHAHSHGGAHESHERVQPAGNGDSNGKMPGTVELKSYTVNNHANTGQFSKEGEANGAVHNGKNEAVTTNELQVAGKDVKLRGWKKKMQRFKGYRSLVYMILIGDAIHNFMDGLVIGVAFTEKFPSGFSGGLSTSIAIFCHEVPHELGDFAVLVSSGMSIPMALCLNFLSSLTAYLGAIVGVSIGQEFNATPWIFAATAGLFVYIALVDLFPELIHSVEFKTFPRVTFLLQSVGLLFGFLVMFFLAAYEEKIKIDV